MLTFKEKIVSETPKTIACAQVTISPEAYEGVKNIANKSGMKMKDVADTLVKYALKEVEWE